MHKKINSIILAIACCSSSLVFAGQPSGWQIPTAVPARSASSCVTAVVSIQLGKSWTRCDKAFTKSLGITRCRYRCLRRKRNGRRTRSTSLAHTRKLRPVSRFYEMKKKKVERIYLMGHSMGSRMTTSYLATNPTAPIAGFIGVGIRNGGG